MRGARLGVIAVMAAIAGGCWISCGSGASSAGSSPATPPSTAAPSATVSIETSIPTSVPPPTTTAPLVSTATTRAATPVDVPPEPVTLLFTGDVIVHEAVADSARQPDGSYDFSPMFDRISPVIGAADLAICHLETPLDPESGSPRGWPRFSAPAELAPALFGAGFDGCSTSSNHVLDRGIGGVADTLDVLDQAGLRHTGTARTPEERGGELYEAGGLTVGHGSYSYNVAGWLPADQKWVANGLDEEQILEDAADLRAGGADFVVISLHWGTEHQYTPTWRQVELGTALAASPLIDLIVGHHAHVLQPVERLDDTVVLYGLGNLLSNQEPGCCGEVAQEGALMLVRIEPRAGSWDVTELRYVPTWVDRHRGHVILTTLAYDIGEHRHAAWLERSARRVGESLQLEDAGLSIESACSWMGVDCAPVVAGAG